MRRIHIQRLDLPKGSILSHQARCSSDGCDSGFSGGLSLAEGSDHNPQSPRSGGP
jgi:hypothetical protein